MTSTGLKNDTNLLSLVVIGTLEQLIKIKFKFKSKFMALLKTIVSQMDILNDEEVLVY